MNKKKKIPKYRRKRSEKNKDKRRKERKGGGSPIQKEHLSGGPHRSLKVVPEKRVDLSNFPKKTRDQGNSKV